MSQLLSSSPTALFSAHNTNDRRIFFGSPRTRDVAIYVSGALFAIGWWAFIDAVVYTAISKDADLIDITFEDWICGVVTTLGMFIVNSVDKSIFSEDVYIYTVSSSVLRKAHLLLFFGFTLLACGLCSSVVVFVINYILNDTTLEKFYFGIAVIVQNVCIMMSTIVLLIGQKSNNELKYDYIL